jgi:hypothetical protein
VESPTIFPVSPRDDEETAYDIVDGIETVWEKTGHEIPEEDACRAWCRLDLLPLVKAKMQILRDSRKLLARVEAFARANPEQARAVGMKRDYLGNKG